MVSIGVAVAGIGVLATVSVAVDSGIGVDVAGSWVNVGSGVVANGMGVLVGPGVIAAGGIGVVADPLTGSTGERPSVVASAVR